MAKRDTPPQLTLALILLLFAGHGALIRARAPAAGRLPAFFPNVNRSPGHELQLLPWIGPVRARAIVRERESGPFRDLADLERVLGIGPATVDELRDFARAARRSPPAGSAPGNPGPPPSAPAAGGR